MLCRLVYGRLIHRPHRLHREGCAGGCFGDLLRRLFGSYVLRFLGTRPHRFFHGVFRLFGDLRACFCRNYLHQAAAGILSVALTTQCGWSQRLRMHADAGDNEN